MNFIASNNVLLTLCVAKKRRRSSKNPTAAAARDLNSETTYRTQEALSDLVPLALRWLSNLSTVAYRIVYLNQK